MKKHKLIQENLLLKAKILLKGGVFHQESELPPEVENEFLKHVLQFEEAVPVPMYEYLKIDPKTFPPEQTLDDLELKAQYSRLEQLLNAHNIVIDLVEALPLRLAYKFLTEEALLEKFEFVDGATLHIDGCSGWCPGCFQADYCSTKDEIWGKEEFERERQKIKKQKR
ncbi:hypothetical protein [Caldithrix abyssi]